MECFHEYSPFLWTVSLSLLTFFDVFYFLRHIWVATEVFLNSRPLYNAMVRLFNKKFTAYIHEHDIMEEDLFESRVLPHEVDHFLQLTDQAGALILELARNRGLYGTGLIAVCWETGTSLWVVSSSRVTWIKRPRLLQKYCVKTLYSPDYEKLHSRYVPIKQVIETEYGEVLCEASVTLVLPPRAQVGDLISKYRERFGEYRKSESIRKTDRVRTLKSLFTEQSAEKKESGDDSGDGGTSSDSEGLKRSKSYGNFLGYLDNLSGILHDDLSGL